MQTDAVDVVPISIPGEKLEVTTYQKYIPSDELATFSVETYRECVLLQNSDSEWGKIKVDVIKISNGVAKVGLPHISKHLVHPSDCNPITIVTANDPS